MFFRQALTFTLLSFGLSLGAQGATELAHIQATTVKPAKLAVKKIRQRDGSVVVRLDMHSSSPSQKRNNRQGMPGSSYSESHPAVTGDAVHAKNSQLMDQWLDAVTEPRFMTALATVAMSTGAEAKSLNKAVDPTTVRNWAEFVDPDLYLRWMASGVDPKLNQAIHNRTPDTRSTPHWIAFPVFIAIPKEFQAGVPLNPTIWSNAYGSTSGGQEAAQEWLTLPIPDPKTNPWLRASQNYRY